MDIRSKIEELEDHISLNGILYSDRQHLPEDMSGLYRLRNGTPAILIDSDLPIQDKLVTLLEELGHYYTSAGNIMPGNTDSVTMSKQERNAIRWAVEYIIQPEDFITAFQAGVRNRYECAEYLGVPEDFLDSAIKIYREKYGYSLQVNKEYELIFVPYFTVHRIL